MRRVLLAVSLLGLLSIACASSVPSTSLVDCAGHGVLVNGRCWCDWGALTSTCAVQADFSRSYGRVDIQWAYDMNSNMLHVQLRANTTGWVGLIVDSSDGGMTQGDAWIAWAADDNSGQAFVSDRWSFDYVEPDHDEPQNLLDVNGWQMASSGTQVGFSRVFDTFDLQDTRIQPGAVQLAAAYGPADPPAWNGTMLPHHHSAFGFFTIDWMQPKGAPSAPGAPALVLPASNSSITVRWASPTFTGSGDGTLSNFTLQIDGVTRFVGLPENDVMGTFTASVHGLSPGTTYSVTVAASNALFGIGVFSSATSMTTLTPSQHPPLPPATPTFISATPTTITLAWRAATPQGADVTGYALQYARPGFPFRPLAGILPVGVLQMTGVGLNASSEYLVQVSALSIAGPSAWSPSALMRTTAYSACPGSTPCSNNGACVQGLCQCARGYVGADCSFATTGEACSVPAVGTVHLTGHCIRWTYDATSLHVQVESYYGLGFWFGWILTPDIGDGMDNGDCWTFSPQAGLSSNSFGSSALEILDRFSPDGMGIPTIDVQQDLTERVGFVRTAAEGAPDSLVAQFSRLLVTNDSQFDHPIVSGPMRVSWAHGSTPQFGPHPHDPTGRGQILIDFLAPFKIGPPVPPTWALPAEVAASVSSVTVHFQASAHNGSSPVTNYTLFQLDSDPATHAYVRSTTFQQLPQASQLIFVLNHTEHAVSIGSGTFTVSVSALQEKTCYPLLLRAANAHGGSNLSLSTYACTLSSNGVVPSAPPLADLLLDSNSTADAVAANLPALSNLPTEIALSWPALDRQLRNASLPALVGYNVFYRFHSGSDEQHSSFAESVDDWLPACALIYESSCNITGLVSSTVYAIVLQSVNLAGSSPFSNVLLVQTAVYARCPSDCSGHGVCVAATCLCDSPFLADDCSVKGFRVVLKEANPYFSLTYKAVDHGTLLEEPTLYAEIASDVSQDMWVGLILAPGGDGMSGGDCLSFSWLADGEAVGWDRNSPSQSQPIVDPVQSLRNVYGYPSVAGQPLRVRFQRALLTGYALDKQITPGPMELSWAVGPAMRGSSSTDPPMLMQHTDSGKGKLKIDWFSGDVVLDTSMSLNIFWPTPIAIILMCALTALLRGWAPLRRTSLAHAVLHRPVLQTLRSMLDLFSTPTAPKSGFRRTWLDVATLDVRHALIELSVGEFLILAAYGVAIAVICWNAGDAFDSAGRLIFFLLGDLTALHLALVLLPVARTSIFLCMCGISFERAVKWHRWIARVTIGLMLAHFITMLLHRDFAALVTVPPIATPSGRGNIFGFCAGASMLLMAAAASEPIRRQAFRFFYYVHLLLLIPIYVLACLHSTTCFRFCIVPFVLYILDRVLRAVRSQRSTEIVGIEVIDVDVFDAASSGGVVGPPAKSDTCVVHLQLRQDGFKHSPGQYAFLNIPQISLIAWHPFTISSAIDESGLFSVHILAQCSGVARLREACGAYSAGIGLRSRAGIISAGKLLSSANSKAIAAVAAQNQRVADGWETLPLLSSTWTGNLLARSERYFAQCCTGGAPQHTAINSSFLPPPMSVRVDGPYGHLNFNMTEDYHTLVLVAGGIGITPLVSILHHLLRATSSPSCPVERVHVVWVSSDANIFHMLHPELWAELRKHAQFQLHFYATRQSTIRVGGHPAVPVLFGRPQWRDVLPTLLTRSARRSGVGGHASPRGYETYGAPSSPSRVHASGSSADVADVIGVTIAEADDAQSSVEARARASPLLQQASWSDDVESEAYGRSVHVEPQRLHASGAVVFACGPAPLIADVGAQATFHGAIFHREVFAL